MLDVDLILRLFTQITAGAIFVGSLLAFLVSPVSRIPAAIRRKMAALISMVFWYRFMSFPCVDDSSSHSLKLFAAEILFAFGFGFALAYTRMSEGISRGLGWVLICLYTGGLCIVLALGG